MKKAILIFAVLVIALVGMTSFNATPDETRTDDRLIASVKQVKPGNVNTGGKKEKQD